jgi:hypothetical protein
MTISIQLNNFSIGSFQIQSIDKYNKQITIASVLIMFTSNILQILAKFEVTLKNPVTRPKYVILDHVTQTCQAKNIHI